MSDVEDDEYFDALPTGGTLRKANETNRDALKEANGDNLSTGNGIPITGGNGQNENNLTAANVSTINERLIAGTISDIPAVGEAVASIGRISTEIGKVTDNVTPDYYNVTPVTDTVTPDYYNVTPTSTHIASSDHCFVSPSVDQGNNMSIAENTNQFADDTVKDTRKLLKGHGNVSQLASQFMERIAKNQSPYNSDQEDVTTTKQHKLMGLPHGGMKEVHKALTRTDLELHQEALTRIDIENHKKTFTHTELDVVQHGASEPSHYSFASPFPEDVTDNGSCGKIHTVEDQGQHIDQCKHDGSEKKHVDSVIDRTGHSHPYMFAVTEGTPNNSNESNLTAEQTCKKADVIVEQDSCSLNQSAFTVHFDETHNFQHINAVDENIEHQDTENTDHIDEENIYDSVHNSLTRSDQVRGGFVGVNHDQVRGGFVVVNHDKVDISHPIPASSSPKMKLTIGRTTERKQKVLAEHVTAELKRQQAKNKSKALKRQPKSDKDGNPFTSHAHFDDPHKGAVPGIEDETMGHFNPFSILRDADSESGSSSCFTDSTFDSSSSESELDDEGSFPDKPLPPKPKKDHQLKDLAHRVLPSHPRKAIEDGSPVIEKVMLNRPRTPPALPEHTGNITKEQIKLRGVLQSLIDSERNYIGSLKRLTDDYRGQILSQVRKPEVKVTFQRVEEMASIHEMFQIEFSDRLKKWNTEERIGNIFYMFSNRMVVDIYSDYVNNYEAASELIRDVESSKQSFKEFLKKKQMESADRLSLSGLMLKPVQRFPQFIMIIKDLLKFSPRDHHDREPLQEAVTWIENVAHQLNERKRQSEQYYHGQLIMARLATRIHPERNIFLIRQDDLEQLSQDTTGSHFVKQRRIFLMNDRLVSVHVSHRDQDAVNSDRFTYKWHQNLRDLELTTSAITPNMQTTVNIGNSSSTILSPKTERSEQDPYDVASELTDMMHDISVLAKINQMVSTLKLAYPGLTEDSIQGHIMNLQKGIQGKDYQLQMLNSSTIILQDMIRKRKYVFSASSATVKQEWCIDFLLAKFALDVVNIPSWHRQDSSNSSQPALLMKHMSVDMQRTFTRVSCGVRVYFPRKNEGTFEHLWICSSMESHGQVSIVSLHTDKPSLIESFQATKCEIICVESVPGYARVEKKAAFEEDTVWMSTADLEIQVFMLSAKHTELHRHCVHKFHVGCLVISMRYIDDHVFCGNGSGTVIVFSRNDDGEWSESRRITLGKHLVTSLICVGDSVWAACGNGIHIIDIDTYEKQGRVEHRLVTTGDDDRHFQYLVKTGVGVWASFIGQANVCLYHSESRRLLQDFNICTAVHGFIKVYSGVEERKNFHVTCLMASLGLLWVGTSVGITLVYPLPRLRDGVPRINEGPQVALHGHSGPVKFLLPVHYGPVSRSPIHRRMESVLRKYNVDDSVMNRLSKVDEIDSTESRPHSYVSLQGDGMAGDNIYEKVNLTGSEKDPSRIYAKIENVEVETMTETLEKVQPKQKDAIASEQLGLKEKDNSNLEGEESDLNKSDTHKYFILEARTDVNDKPEQEVANVGDSAAACGSSQRGENLHANLKPENRTGVVDWLKESHRNFKEVDRKSMTISFDGFDRKPLTFQSELKNKLKHRRSLEDLTDLDATQDDVGILYPTLVRPQTKGQSAQSLRDSMMSASLPDVSQEPARTSVYMRPRMSASILAKKPETSSTRSLNKESKKKDKKEKKRAVSFNKDDVMENKRQSAVGTSFSAGSSVDTLRKQDSNTIIVLSGGDGYKDWKKRQNLSNYRPEEPCLIFWMYRF